MSLGWKINEYGWVVDEDIKFIKYNEAEELLFSVLNNILVMTSPFVEEMTDLYGEVKPAVTPNIHRTDIPLLPSNRMIITPDFTDRERASKTRYIYEFQIRLHYFGPEGGYYEYIEGAKNWNKIVKYVCDSFSKINVPKQRIKLAWNEVTEFESDIINQTEYDRLVSRQKRPLNRNIIYDTFSVRLMTTHNKKDVFRKKLFDWLDNLTGIEQR